MKDYCKHQCYHSTPDFDENHGEAHFVAENLELQPQELENNFQIAPPNHPHHHPRFIMPQPPPPPQMIRLQLQHLRHPHEYINHPRFAFPQMMIPPQIQPNRFINRVPHQFMNPPEFHHPQPQMLHPQPQMLHPQPQMMQQLQPPLLPFPQLPNHPHL